MSSFPDIESKEVEDDDDDDEDVDMDVDFNPFAKETLSPEASSSLSSETLILEKPKNFDPESVRSDHVLNEFASNGDGDGDGDGADDDDAICRRTRARYSLVNFTLDELETFLQESDDEDDLPNVDDEAEYRKFLAGVLQGDGQIVPEIENVGDDDEDEDNDADFEIEIEEALESDIEENLEEKPEKGKFGEVGSRRRPETRQNRSRNKCFQSKNRVWEQGNRQLRPIIPILSNPPILTMTCSETAPNVISSSPNDWFGNGFSPKQIGQLHCLIHEHVQLLVQVYSLCVLEPSRQPIAVQVQQLISEMLQSHEQGLASRSVPHPVSCSRPAYTLQECTSGPSHTVNAASQATEGPLFSVLDVGPLHLAGKYMEDVSIAARDYQRRHVEPASDLNFDKEPLFPLPGVMSYGETDGEVIGVNTSLSHPPPKKTLAAALVESTMKQAVASVPKPVVKLAQRFLPLFNPALFPHKPPPSAVVNRVLFTDSEDELLAIGMMRYNTDWDMIRENFLPGKSKHQIFVRQKNRCSSKAPENPIKDVRRMKTSPLTEEEKARIQEGLKVLNDWGAVWRLMVPHRDPSLLQRQWRVAIGTQKTYKMDEEQKEKRRLQDSQRRMSMLAASTNQQPEKQANQTEKGGEENKSGDDSTVNDREAYVHEAFLADWRPSELPSPKHKQRKVSSSQYASYSYPTVTSSNHTVSCLTTKTSRSKFCSIPYRAHRTAKNNFQMVKLAPHLPPVNLPPSVRIISQSAFKNYQSGPPTKVASSLKAQNNPNPCPQESGPLKDKRVVVEENDSSELLQMHPLLFQAPEDGRLPYYPLNRSNATSRGSFSFNPGNQPQLNLSLFHNPTLSRLSKEVTSSSSPGGIDFHPLLQRTTDTNRAAVTEPLRTNCEPSTSPNGLASNEVVDLEINLCSSLGTNMETENGNSFRFQQCENSFLETAANPSLAGIVMEQEELSDSDDEENVEHVEFEREEMADSEGEEGSYSEQVLHVQNEDVRNVAINDVQQCETSIDLTEKRNTASCSGRSSWLSLDSCSPSKKAKNKNAEKDSAAKTETKLRPKRPRKAKPSTETQQEKQLTLDSDIACSSKKPRKRVYRKKSSISSENANQCG